MNIPSILRDKPLTADIVAHMNSIARPPRLPTGDNAHAQQAPQASTKTPRRR
ncbi:MAG: hypothetical protein AAGG55_10900 [Pseudomonadota bacterium]